MFRFLELELHGWDLWSSFRVPLDAGVVVLSGLNGSGKTTLLDAVRQLLHAPKLSQNRRLTHYLRRPNQPALLRAVVSNPADARGRRPFDRQQVFSDEATLACALIPSGGTPEKRFVVLPGRVSGEQLKKRLLDSREWLGPDDYRRVLEYAGVSRSLMHILALEQGRADELARRKPRDLFKWVMEARGNQQVLERYTAARRRYEESLREVDRQRQQVVKSEATLKELERKVRRLDEYDERRKKVLDAERELEASKLQSLLLQTREIERKLPEMETRIANLTNQVLSSDADLGRIREQLGQQDMALRDAESTTKRSLEERDSAVAEFTRLDVELQKVKAQQFELLSLAPEDMEELRTRLTEERRSLFDLERRAQEAMRALETWKARLVSLSEGVPVLPETVELTLRALDRERIAARLTARTVEVREPAWAPAVESALGNLRYALCVPEDSAARAVEIARQHDYPGPLVTEPAESFSQEGVLRMEAPAPEWMSRWSQWTHPISSDFPSAEGELTLSGVRRDRHGLWVSRAPDRVLGGEAVRVQLESAKAELAIAETLRAGLARSAAATEARIEELESRIQRQEHRQRLAVAVERLEACREEREAASLVRERALAAHDQAASRLLESQSQRDSTKNRLGVLTSDRDARQKELEGLQLRVAEDKRKLRACEPERNGLYQKVEGELRRKAEAEELDTVELVSRSLERAQRAVQEMELEGPLPPDTVREEQRMLAHNLDELQAHVRSRQDEADSAAGELGLCRGDYLDVVRGTLRDYARRARSLAELAAAELHVELPELIDDDRVLDEAGIVVRIGFDGKPPTELDDTAHSGGQQVVAGLVLLMAMAETEGDSFFIVDEPFAHLSLDRVDDVGKFLRRSGAQFLITVPTTLDRGQLDPASLVIVLQKKPAAESFAPRPIVAR